MKKILMFVFMMEGILSTPFCIGREIHEHGFWVGTDILDQHAFDPQLAGCITKFLKKEKAQTIVDLGCGKGDYVKTFQQNGLCCEGYDGNPDSPELSGGVAKVADLSQPLELGKTFDWVLSLEVGEHIPKLYEKQFLENLVHHAQHGIVLSWAVPGQGGYGHVNNQDNDYIKARLYEYGFVIDDAAASEMRDSAKLFWFKNTILVFRKVREV